MSKHRAEEEPDETEEPMEVPTVFAVEPANNGRDSAVEEVPDAPDAE